MKKLVFLILLLTLSGCSFNVNFYIYNESSEPITVEYEFKNEIDFGVFVKSPRIQKFSSYDDLENVENKNIIIDSKSKIITAMIDKGEVLWIGSILNYSKKYKNKREQVYENLLGLKIIKGSSELNVNGELAEGLFKKINQQQYGIIIK